MRPLPLSFSRALPLSLLLGVACGPKQGAVQAAADAATAATTVSLDLPTPLPDHSVRFAPPPPTVLSLASGGSLWLVERHDLPLVSLRLLVPGGKAADPADQPGLVSFADSMLTHGAGDMDAQAFAAATDQLAIDVGAQTTNTYTVINLETHADHLDAALYLLALAVLSPRFDDDEVERVRDVRQGALAVAMDSPRTVASWVSDHVYYGAGHPLAHPGQGTVDSTAAASADDLRTSWEARRASAAPSLVVVGDVDADSLVAKLDARLASWAVTGTPPAAPPPAAGVSDGPKLFMVDNPGASQTMLEVLMPGPAVADDSVDAARLGTIVLGGTFTSRLNRLLREDKGYTYGAYARLFPATTHGVIQAGSAVQRDVTAPALTDLLAEVDRLQQGITDDELSKAQGANQTSMIESASGRGSLADAYSRLLRTGQAPTALDEQITASAAVTAQQALDALSTTTTQHATVVVVGDLSEIQDAVQAAVPGEWTVLDKLGEAAN